LNQFIWIVRRIFSRAGVLEVAGASLFLASVLAYFALIYPQMDPFAISETASVQAGGPAGGLESSRDTNPTSLAVLKALAGLPQSSEATALIGKILSIASAQHVEIAQADYRLLPATSESRGRLQVTLPIKDTYPRVQAFLADVMNQMPGVALDGVSFQRIRISDGNIDAQIRLTIFFADA
jgi:hypothetical protein